MEQRFFINNLVKNFFIDSFFQMFVIFYNRIRVEAENLKNQEEAERIDREATEDALRQMAELDAQLQVYNTIYLRVVSSIG